MTDEFDDVLTQLDALRFTPDRSEASARSGLQIFLNEAAGLRPTVSARPARRLTGWMSQLWLRSQLSLRSKFTQERSPMFALAIKFVLVLAVMLGGAGVTAAAAQSSLPNETLYPVKLLVEEVQLSLASTPDAQIDLQLEQAQQRVREMAQLTNRGVAIPGEVPARLQTRLQTALQIAAQLDDQHLPGALDRIQLRTQDQLRELDQLHLNEATQILTQARALAQLGQQDPQAFRARFGYGRPDDAPPPPQNTPRADPSRTPAGPQVSVTPQHTCTPQATHTPQHTAQPQVTHTPQPQQTRTPQGESYGPGPQNTPPSVATPIGGDDGHEDGPGPQPTDAPGEGSGEPQPQNTPQGSGSPPEPPTPGGSGSSSGSQAGGNSSGGRP